MCRTSSVCRLRLSFSLAHGMADQYVAVKSRSPSSNPLACSPLLIFPLSLSSPPPSSLPLVRRTNDQRNVNRKPREATLINPTEINCSAQRRSISILLLVHQSASSSFVHSNRFYSPHSGECSSRKKSLSLGAIFNQIPDSIFEKYDLWKINRAEN